MTLTPAHKSNPLDTQYILGFSFFSGDRKAYSYYFPIEGNRVLFLLIKGKKMETETEELIMIVECECGVLTICPITAEKEVITCAKCNREHPANVDD